MKKIWIILILFVPLMITKEAIASDIKVVQIYFFANTLFETNDFKGRYVRLPKPLSEYKSITHWDAAERALSPDKIDVVVIVKNDRNQTISAKLDLYEKAASFLTKNNHGPADFDRINKTATWSPKPEFSETKTFPDSNNGFQVIKFNNIDIKKLITSRVEKQEAVSAIKAAVRISCDNCQSSSSAEKILKVQVGD